jgi:hypothetical protein
MSATKWLPLPKKMDAVRRAAKRKSYNLARTRRTRLIRRRAVLRYCQLLALQDNGRLRKPWGIQAEVARELGIHRSTVCRALAVHREAEQKGYHVLDLEDDLRIRHRLDKRDWRSPDKPFIPLNGWSATREK